VREEFHVTSQLMLQSTSSEGTIRGKLDLQLPRRHLHEFLGAIVEIPAVREIRELSPRKSPDEVS
jgi:hypothetical protein